MVSTSLIVTNPIFNTVSPGTSRIPIPPIFFRILHSPLRVVFGISEGYLRDSCSCCIVFGLFNETEWDSTLAYVYYSLPGKEQIHSVKTGL